MARNERTALITGASSGIGLELARLFAADRSNLILVARSEDKLNTLANELSTRHGVNARVIRKDLTALEAPEELFAECQQANATVDVLVNNAGYGGFGLFAEMNQQFQLDMVQLNVTTLTHLTRLFVPGMLKRGFGRILNVASTAAFQPGPTMGVYYATKAFVLSLSEALATELARTGVTVTALCPGPTESGFQAAADLEGSRLLKFGMMSSAEVARIGYEAMNKGRVVVIPGVRNWLLAESVRFGPRALVRNIVRFVQAKE